LKDRVIPFGDVGVIRIFPPPPDRKRGKNQRGDDQSAAALTPFAEVGDDAECAEPNKAPDDRDRYLSQNKHERPDPSPRKAYAAGLWIAMQAGQKFFCVREFLT